MTNKNDTYCLQATIEHRKLAVDLAEVVVKWEVQRIRDEQEQVSEVGYSCRILHLWMRLLFHIFEIRGPYAPMNWETNYLIWSKAEII